MVPGGTSGKEPACQCRRPKRRGFHPWVGKIPWRRAWQPTPVFLPGESHGQRSLAGYSPQGRRESDTTERLSVPICGHMIFNASAKAKQRDGQSFQLMILGNSDIRRQNNEVGYIQ